MTALHQQHCRKLKAPVSALDVQAVEVHFSQLGEHWQLDLARQELEADFEFADYPQTLAFANAVAWIAEQQDHHPSLVIEYRHCRVRFTTHQPRGLTLKDFICAARVDQLLE